MHTKLLDEIITKGKKEDMEVLSEVFDCAMEFIEETDEEMYRKLEEKMYVALNGKMLTYERAEYIVQNMKPCGEYWTIEQTEKVRSENHLSEIRDIDFYIVMNSARNDYKNLFDEDVTKYIEYAKLFINDSDAKEDKVYIYYTNIPK